MSNDKTLEGTIHTTIFGWKVIYEDGKYYMVCPFNFHKIYLTTWSNREKVFEFYAQDEIDFCEESTEMYLRICRFFKRTNSNNYKTLNAEFSYLVDKG